MTSARKHIRPAGTSWASRYSGIPFVDRGFTTSGVHCWGLIWLVYRQELGILLKDYGATSAAAVARAAAQIGAHKALPPWEAIAELAHGQDAEQLIGSVILRGRAQSFDVVTMLNGDGSSESHVGVMVDGRHVLHTEAVCGTVIVDLKHATVRWRLTGIYRHEDVS